MNRFLETEDRGDHIRAIVPAGAVVDDAVQWALDMFENKPIRFEFNGTPIEVGAGMDRDSVLRRFCSDRAAMQKAANPSKIEIELNAESGNRYGWTVRYGDWYADELVWDEMLGLAVTLMAQIGARGAGGFPTPGMQWLKTAEQHAADKARRDARLAELEAQREASNGNG